LQAKPVLLLWITVPAAGGIANLVPVAVTDTRALGTLAEWQVSQLALYGMCVVVPLTVVDAGIATMAVTPVKVVLVTPAPWQVAQPVVNPLWLNLPPAKVELLPTGVVSGPPL
jgi:hypothetical protein